MNMSQELQWVRYIPLRVDNSFRCDGFPPYVPEAQYYAFESTRFFDPRDGKDGGFDSIVSVYLFNLMYQMKERKGAYRAYALVYFDENLPYQTYKKRLASLRKAGARIAKQIRGGLVPIIEAGRKHENRLELFLLPSKWKPPAPDPTLPSPIFMRARRSGSN